LNNNYYETLDKNFEQALNLYETNYTHDELIELLKTGNIVQKQISALRLESINSSYDANIVIDNLTGQDGKIREAVSLKLVEFMSNNTTLKYFKNKEFYGVFLDAVTDINANICRNVICAIVNLKSEPNFVSIFCPKLVELTYKLLDIVEKFNSKDGKYKVNKELFKLYWCLETIYEFWDVINFEDLKNILYRAKNIQEYTIREKVGKILARDFDNVELQSIKKELTTDSNYYVRRTVEK
jgi:hypothetical protein